MRPGQVGLRDLAVPLVTLANAEGGHVLVGVTDDGVVQGVEPARIDEIRQCAHNYTTPVVRTYLKVIDRRESNP